MVDTFYYFDKSTKRKNGLSDYCAFCDVEFRQVLKDISTRWLSLESAVSRVLLQYPGLTSYFISEYKYCVPLFTRIYSVQTLYSLVVPEMATGRDGRLMRVYSSPMTEVYLLFLQSALQVFVSFNKFLQREDSILPVLLQQIESFLTKLFGRFLTVSVIRDAESITTVDYTREKQLPGKCLPLIACTTALTQLAT